MSTDAAPHLIDLARKDIQLTLKDHEILQLRLGAQLEQLRKLTGASASAQFDVQHLQFVEPPPAPPTEE
jgi:hypothetical protein